jgi:hypothetical protein
MNVELTHERRLEALDVLGDIVGSTLGMSLFPKPMWTGTTTRWLRASGSTRCRHRYPQVGWQ